MALHLKPGEHFPSGIRRILRSESAAARACLVERPDSGGEAVHRARKHLKKLRSTLRVARDGIDRKFYHRESRAFAAMARALAVQRDLQVLLQTITKLEREGVDTSARKAFDKLRAAQPDPSMGIPTASLSKVEVASRLMAAEKRADKRQTARLDWEGVRQGLKRSYRRGRDVLHAAEKSQNNEILHLWRKRVKDLWYQLALFETIFPKPVSKLARKARHLSDLLGEDHDLAMVECAARKALDAAEIDALTGPLQAHRAHLQAEALKLGRRIYGDAPGGFAHWLDACWKERRRE